jgi:hypothetical protein
VSKTEPFNQGDLVGKLLRQRFGAGAKIGTTNHCSTPHLDDDSFNAFVEGRLSDAEIVPITSHLVECGPCRHASAELLRLSGEFDLIDAPVSTVEREPGRIRKFLDDLVSRVLATDESAVFAYHSPSEPQAGSPAEPPVDAVEDGEKPAAHTGDADPPRSEK